MEERKLIRLGNSSFAIALPKDWIIKSGLKKGDKVFLIPNSNGEILLSSKPQKTRGDNKITIETNNLTKYSLKKEMVSAYIKGYDELQFIGKNNRDLRNEIKKIENNLIGFEIVDNNENQVIIKDFFSLEEIDIINFIRRMDNNIRELFDIILGALEPGKLSKKEFEEIKNIDKDINKFYLLLSRIMFKGLDNPSILSSLKLEANELFNIWWCSFNLEHI